MRKPSPAQLRALARIHLSGLLMREEGMDLPFSAILDLAPPNTIVVNVSTVRVLVRDGLITRVRFEDDPPDLDYRWRTSKKGRELIHQHREYLAEVGPEISRYNTLSALMQISLSIERPPNSRN